MSHPIEKEVTMMRMNRNRVVLLGSILALSGCEVIGDASETIGGLVSPHLATIGGGPPVLSDDGGRAVDWYLHQVAAEPYEDCDALRDEALAAVLSRDSEHIEELEARAEALGEDFQPHLDEMGLSLRVQVPARVGERLGGGTLTLDSCSFENCLLGCEGLFTVQEVTEKDDQGEQKVQFWSSPDQLRKVGDRRATELVCQRHPYGSVEAGAVDEHYQEWKRDLAIAGGEDAEGLDSYSGPNFDIDFNIEEDEERPNEIKAGETLKVRVSHLESCLESDGASVKLQAPSAPEIWNPTIECADGEGDAAEGSLVIAHGATSPGGPLGLGLDGDRAQIELMVTETNSEDMTQVLVFHHSQAAVVCELPEEDAKDRSLRDMRQVLSLEMDGDAYNQIKPDDRKIQEAYKKHVRTNPNQKLECKTILGEKELGDFKCDEEGKDYSYQLIFKDKDGHWSRPTSVY